MKKQPPLLHPLTREHVAIFSFWDRITSRYSKEDIAAANILDAIERGKAGR